MPSGNFKLDISTPYHLNIKPQYEVCNSIVIHTNRQYIVLYKYTNMRHVFRQIFMSRDEISILFL